MIKVRLLISLYILTLIGLFLYSYTQVDLSLTLSKFSLWQVVEKSFQYIGYFQRPLSTTLYILLLVLLFGGYTGLLIAAYKKNLERKTIWLLVFFIAILLTFAYNAFSYDLFNYIFDAKVVTFYHSNPYHHYALQYPHDPMLSFMHWVERTYPYGPLWLGITVPFSFIGGQIFLITFYLFKIIASLSYVGTAYFIEKTAKKIAPAQSLFSLVLFAFSPLVLIEGLVSGHNDMVMIFLSALALYLLVSKQYVTSFFSLAASIATKFATAIWVPLWIVLVYVQSRKKNNHYEIFMIVGSLISLIPVILATQRTNFQPWYFLYVLPFAVLTKKTFIFVPFIIFSLFALLQYIPFLYTGNWNPPIPMILNELAIVGIIVSFIVALGLFIYNLSVAKRN